MNERMRGIGRRAAVCGLILLMTGLTARAQEQTYCIYTFEDLKNLSCVVEESGRSFPGEVLLMNDVEAQGGVAPIGSPENMFVGSFDGQGYSIYGLHVEADEFSGLFGYIGIGGSVKNLTLIDPQVSGTRYTGGIAGYSAGSIENCAVMGGRIFGESVAEFGAGTGGIAGLSCGTIRGCVNRDAQVIGRRNVGGIVGSQCAGSVGRCLNTGLVWSWDAGEALTGGIAGSVQTGGEISRCVHAGQVFAPDAAWVGGIAGGILSGQMSRCISLGEVAGREPGSVAGYVARRAQIMACIYAAGNPVGEGRDDGALRLPVRPVRLNAELLLPLIGE